MIGKKDDKPYNPVTFVKPGEKWQHKPVSFIEQGINDTNNFAILKTTENGKYMRGGMLYYCLDGVEIYTEEDNIIFVDMKNKRMWVKKQEKVLQEIAPTDPEQRNYIMLYTDLGYSEDTVEEFPLRWEAVVGRSTAYENIKVNAPVIDIDRSLVLVDNVALKDSLSVRQFCEYLKNANIINDESFDIKDFSGSDYI